MKFCSAAAAALFLALAAPAQLSGQRVYTGLPGQDVGSIALNLGAILPSTSLPDGSNFNSGLAGGAAITIWPFRHLGMRGNLLYGQSGVSPGAGSRARVALEDPNVLLYSGELALRYPMESGRFAWFPYLSAGVGGKTYRWAHEFTGLKSNFNGALTYSGGVEVRPSSSPRYGFVVGMSQYRTTYSWHSFHFDNADLTDTMVTVGVTFNR